ncbi:MAG: hypothetical protein ACQCN5_01305 [Candidatus Bathyarchaeia archaeon]
MVRVEEDEFVEHKYDGFLIFLCFLGSSLVGYVIMNHLALLGF